MEYTLHTENYILCVEKKPTEASSADLSCLSIRELQFYESLVNESRKIEFLYSRVLLKSILGQDYQEIVYLLSGKPTMRGVQISISHSSSFIGVIISKTSAVAMDIEEYRPRVMHIRSKFVRSDEQDVFQSIEDSILLWSAKETLFKMTNATPDLCAYKVEVLGESSLQGYVRNGDKQEIIKMSYFRNEKYCLVWAVDAK